MLVTLLPLPGSRKEVNSRAREGVEISFSLLELQAFALERQEMCEEECIEKHASDITIHTSFFPVVSLAGQL